MNSADLKIFEAVARHGGMSAAAAELNTVQSNVTTRVRHLEEELGVTLFHRHSRGVDLTEAGHRLLPYATDIRRLLGDAQKAVQDDGAPAGALTIGSLETTAALRLSPILERYASAYPDVDLVLRTGTTAELIDAVLNRSVEGAFVCGPVRHPALTEETVFREELVLAAAANLTSIDDLAANVDIKIVVLRVGCSYRQRLEEVLARRGIVGLRHLEFGTLDSIVGCVAAGLGVTLMPRGIVESAWREGRLSIHTLPVSEAIVETQFIRRRDAFKSSAATAFLDCARPLLDRAEAAE